MSKQIVQYLSSIKWPDETRRSVKICVDYSKKRFVLGEVLQYTRGFRLGRMTKKHPELALMVNKWIKKKYPSFRYSSIQVNEGISPLHVDKMNCGPSLVIWLGDYEGGLLWSWGNRPHILHNINNKGIIIDGNLPHMNSLTTSGKRYSFVCFTMKGKWNAMARE